MDDRLLTVKQVAQQVQASEETVRRWLRDGKLKGIQLAGRRLGWRIKESELRRFLSGE
jgi:excisionase family DNA binding protein